MFTIRKMSKSASPERQAAAAAPEQIQRFLGAWFAIRQIIQAANFNRFHKAGLSATQFMILNILPETSQGLAISALATKTNLAAATIVKTVDSLEERGMIRRARSQSDRRAVLVTITAKGRRLQNAASSHFREHIASLFEAMPTRERAALVDGLESLVRAARRRE